MNPTYLGIDFGTTKTLVSRYDTRKNMSRPVRLGRGTDSVPTSVFIESNGCFYFGADADDQSAAAPRNYRRAFKLDIGTSTYLLSVRTEKERQRFTAADLTKKFLGYILQQCAEKSYPCDRAVVTRPVDFSPLQEKQLQEAAISAGLKEIIFITEPEAAGYAYRMECADTNWQNALVVDWGGGTLDMALVSQSGNELHANRRYRDGTSCGGENFDDALRLLATQIIRSGSDASLLGEDETDLSWLYNSRRQFRKEKELLSEQNSRVLHLVSHDGVPYRPIKLNRHDFEDGIMPELQRAAKMAKSLISSIRERSLKPEFILLVGGSSQIPAVKRILEQETGLECRTFDQGNEAVSLGAALYAHKLWGCPEMSPTQEAFPEIPPRPSEPPSPTSEPSPVSPQPQPEPIPQPKSQPIPERPSGSAAPSSPNSSSQPKPAPKTQPSSTENGSWKVFVFLLLAGFLFFLINGGFGDLLPWFFQLIVAFIGAGSIMNEPKYGVYTIVLIIKKLWLD